MAFPEGKPHTRIPASLKPCDCDFFIYISYFRTLGCCFFELALWIYLIYLTLASCPKDTKYFLNATCRMNTTAMSFFAGRTTWGAWKMTHLQLHEWALSLSLFIYIYHLFPKKHSIQQSFESLNVGFTMVHDNCHTVLPDYIFHIKSLSSVLHDGVSIISCRHGGVPGENLRTTWLSGPCAFAQLGMQWCEPWILGKRFGAGHDGV